VLHFDEKYISLPIVKNRGGRVGGDHQSDYGVLQNSSPLVFSTLMYTSCTCSCDCMLLLPQLCCCQALTYTHSSTQCHKYLVIMLFCFCCFVCVALSYLISLILRDHGSATCKRPVCQGD